MTFDEKLRAYAKLIIGCGVHVEQGQDVVLRISVDNREFARMLVEEAYDAGARDVTIRWTDSKIRRLRYDKADLSVFETVEPWDREFFETEAQRKAVFISITGDDPEAFHGVDSRKQMAESKASHEAFPIYRKMMMGGLAKWNVSAVPSPAWAKKVYPELSEEKAMEALWDAIFACARIGEGDPVELWNHHAEVLAEKCRILNQYQFDSLHYQNSIGTDFTVGLVEDHRWEGGADTYETGVKYFANIPTEEVFTMPHREKAEGTLVSALPLSYRGKMIRNFSITFRDGIVVSYQAEEGEEALKQLFDTDEGSKHLGEAALVPYPSPVAEQGVLFYNTLFDENAACHFAFGACYPINKAGGTSMSTEELLAEGGNDSINHVDFMIGTKDLSVTGITKDGKNVPIFKDGTWAI